MSRLSSILVFFTISMGMLFGIHYYIWARLVRDTLLPAPYRQVTTALLIALGASMPLTFIVGRVAGRDAARWLNWPAFVWMGLMAMLFLVLVGGDAVRLVLFVGKHAAGRGAPLLDPERRLLLGRLGGLTAPLPGAWGGFGGGGAQKKVGLKRLRSRSAACRARSTASRSCSSPICTSA